MRKKRFSAQGFMIGNHCSPWALLQVGSESAPCMRLSQPVAPTNDQYRRTQKHRP